MSARVPKKEPPYMHMGKNIRSPPTEPHADGRPTYNGMQPGSPLEDHYDDTAISTPVPCSLWHNTFHLGLGRPETP